MNNTIEFVVEAEAVELQALAAKQNQEAIVELNSAQLALIGGGATAIIID